MLICGSQYKFSFSIGLTVYCDLLEFQYRMIRYFLFFYWFLVMFEPELTLISISTAESGTTLQILTSRCLLYKRAV